MFNVFNSLFYFSFKKFLSDICKLDMRCVCVLSEDKTSHLAVPAKGEKGDVMLKIS